MKRVKNCSNNYIDVESQWKALAKIDYSFYCEYVHRGQWKLFKYLQHICKKLEALERGEITRLMLFLPPRHGKSWMSTEAYPSFFIGKDPNRRVISVSYGDDLAERAGKSNRQKIQEYGKEIFDIELDASNASKTSWDIAGHRGGMISRGIGGGITGQGADLLIIDDPIKNRAEAESKTYRDKIYNEWTDTLKTRLHPGGRVILIMTRWHQDDLAGRLLKEMASGGEQWEVVNLPAECEVEEDEIGRKKGDMLCPERGYNKEWAEGQKRYTRTWASLYQQHPRPNEGNIFKRDHFKRYISLPPLYQFDQILQSWDCSFKGMEDNDYVVGQVWGRVGINYYLIHQMRGHWNFKQTIEAIQKMTQLYPQASMKLIEEKANGAAIINVLSSKIAGLIPIVPKESKQARAWAVQPSVESGNVYLPDASVAPWVEDAIEEIISFPSGENDDVVDAFTQALIRLSQGFEAWSGSSDYL